MCDKFWQGLPDDRAVGMINFSYQLIKYKYLLHTYEMIRAIRLSGRGRTEAAFSCLFVLMVLTNMLLIMLGSDMMMMSDV